jgi:hypothetical protein
VSLHKPISQVLGRVLEPIIRSLHRQYENGRVIKLLYTDRPLNNSPGEEHTDRFCVRSFGQRGAAIHEPLFSEPLSLGIQGICHSSASAIAPSSETQVAVRIPM